LNATRSSRGFGDDLVSAPKRLWRGLLDRGQNFGIVDDQQHR
jgi:hypothetical protein